MDIIAKILSPWIGDGTPVSNPYRPQFSDDFPAVTWQDVTGTDAAQLIPPVNLLVLEIVTDEQTYGQIEQQYAVIWAEAEEQPADGE
jgi:hypothetical protein